MNKFRNEHRPITTDRWNWKDHKLMSSSTLQINESNIDGMHMFPEKYKCAITTPEKTLNWQIIREKIEIWVHIEVSSEIHRSNLATTSKTNWIKRSRWKLAVSLCVCTWVCTYTSGYPCLWKEAWGRSNSSCFCWRKLDL